MKKHKFLFMLLCVSMMVMAMLSIQVYADTYSGTCGANATWELDTTTGVLTISGNGDMYDYSSSTSAPWYSYRDIIETVVINHGVTSIGSRSFYYCSSLTDVDIPNSVTSIGSRSFYYCSSLTDVDIPNKVTSIGDEAFYSCSSLTNINIPNGITSINDGTFYGCIKLTNIIIPNSVTSIGMISFYECTSLTSLVIPGNVESINRFAFNRCTGLTDLTISNGVMNIGDSAFFSCTNLTSIVIPSSVVSIDDAAFAWCTKLTVINVNANNQYYTNDSYGVLYNKNMTILMQYPSGNTRTEFTVPSTVTSITRHAFAYSPLTSVTISSNVESISEYCFRYCSNLKNVIILGAINSIETGVFDGCDMLESITIPDSVTSIGSYAFADCSNLTRAYFMGNVPTTLNISAFRDTASTFTIYYIEGKSGWTSPTWTSPSGEVYNTATFNPSGNTLQTTFDTTEITLQIGETFDFVGSATQTNGNIDKVYIGIVKYDDESNGIDYFYTENIGQSIYDFSMIPSFTAGSTLINIKHTNTIQDSLTLGVGKYVLRMWVNNDQDETSGEIRKIINVVDPNKFKPTITGLESNYNVTQGEDVEIKFTVKAVDNGKLGRVTLKYNVEKTNVIHTFDLNTDTLNVTGLYINALPTSELSEPGTYEFCIYASADNYMVADNLIAKFTVTVIPQTCPHTEYTFIKYSYDKQYYDDNTHSLTIIPNYKCNICNCIFIMRSTYQLSPHNDDINLDNNGWICDCGYVYTGNFNVRIGYLQSSQRERVYNKVLSDGTLVDWDGESKVFPEDNIEVLGTKNNAFLIRYNIISGGTKTKFIDRNLIDYYPFIGKKIQYFNINDVDVKTIYSENDASNSNLKYYAEIDKLPSAIIACNLKYIGNNYTCTLDIGDPKTSVRYSMAVNLNNYVNHNWTNVYAVENINNSTINGFSIGAYVHNGKIYIEIIELLDFLGYECIDDYKHIYIAPGDERDHELIGAASKIYNTSRSFDQIYESFNDTASLKLSEVFYTLMLDFESRDNIAGIKDGTMSEQKLIDEIKASLLTDVMNLPSNMQEECNDFLKEIIDSYKEICNIGSEVPDIINETIITQLFNNNLKGIHLATKTQKIFDKASESLSIIGILIDLYDFQLATSDLASVTMTEVYCTYVLAKNYENNIKTLDNLINTAQTSKMKAIYTKIKDELSAYYENNIVKIFYYLAENSNIRQSFAHVVYTGYTLIVDTAILLIGEPFYPYALYKMLSSYVDTMFTGTAMYNAQNEIIKLNQSIELYEPELINSIQNYINYPNNINKDILITKALILGKLRLDAIKYCRELIYNQNIINIFDYWFNNYQSLDVIDNMLYEDETVIGDCIKKIEEMGGKK